MEKFIQQHWNLMLLLVQHACKGLGFPFDKRSMMSLNINNVPISR